jgi:pimeloyl-ACP methyl ester carboxylesterase
MHLGTRATAGRAALVLAVTAAATLGGPPATAGSMNPGRTAGSGTTGAAEPAAAESLSWRPCPPRDDLPDLGPECATVPVPVDYADPGAGATYVNISRIPASDPANRRGVLMINLGGPGNAGLVAPTLAKLLFNPQVADHYDLIGFDPRGVGTSDPVTCGLTALRSARTMPPLEEPTGFDATVSFMNSVAADCSRTYGPKLRHVTTANTARDMDRVRQTLGEETISYFGYSYGTYLGAAYSSLFPERLDLALLDSVVMPSAVWRAQFQSWGPGGEIRFPDFVRFAVDNEATYGIGSTPEDVNARYFALIQRLGVNPITMPDGELMDDEMFREYSFSGLYADSNFPWLADLWKSLWEATGPSATEADRAAAQSRFGVLQSHLGLDDPVPVDNKATSALAIACNDTNAWPQDPEVYQRDQAAADQHFPHFGRLGSGYWACAQRQHWADHAPTPIVPTQGRVLLLQNERDPATPATGAADMRRLLGNRSRAVIVPEGGHLVYGVGTNTCANQVGTNFLLTGVLPARDLRCAEDATIGNSLGIVEPRQSPRRERAVIEVLSRQYPVGG